MKGELFRFRDTATPVVSVHLHAYPMHNAILILLANREPVRATRYEAAVSQNVFIGLYLLKWTVFSRVLLQFPVLSKLLLSTGSLHLQYGNDWLIPVG